MNVNIAELSFRHVDRVCDVVVICCC